MGFFVMILSFVLGIFLVVLGISSKKGRAQKIIFAAIGIMLVLFAIYLGLPKWEVLSQVLGMSCLNRS